MALPLSLPPSCPPRYRRLDSTLRPGPLIGLQMASFCAGGKTGYGGPMPLVSDTAPYL